MNSGEKMPGRTSTKQKPKGLRPKPRDHDILAHVARYRISTLNIIHQLFYEPEGRSVEASKSTLYKRLIKAGLLQSQPLNGTDGEVYYHLTEAGAAAAGVNRPEEASGVIKEKLQRARRLAVLLFCCRGETAVLRDGASFTPRPKFDAQDFDTFFKGMRAPGTTIANHFASDDYYLDTDPETGRWRLGLILVNFKGLEVVFWARKRLAQLDGNLFKFLRADRLTFALLLGCPEQSAAVRRQLLMEPLSRNGLTAHLVIEAYPELRRALETNPPRTKKGHASDDNPSRE